MALAWATQVGLEGTAVAADGVIVRTLNAEGYSCSVGTGIAFDGVNLLLSCNDDNTITAIDPSDGSLVETTTIDGMTSIGALAYDRGRNQTWACGGFSGDDTQVWLIDVTSGTANLQFSGTPGCPDGLAYDGSDDTLWLSPDAGSTMYHYDLEGNQLGAYDVSLGGCGNSGIAVGGSQLFLANDGCGEIYRSSRDTPADAQLFGSYNARLEDLECDDISMRSDGMTVVWSKDAYDNVLNAFQVDSGSCGFGGVTSTVDDDGDGLPNSWETNGVFVNGVKVADLPAMGADPEHKDLFLRNDGEIGSTMSAESRRVLMKAFKDGPISNPDGTPGVAVHFLPGSTLKASKVDSLTRGTGPNYKKIFDFWRSEDSYQPLYARYILGVHWKDWGPEAQAAGIPSQIVTDNSCSHASAAECKRSDKSHAVVVMHELGHTLGLHHGGNDNLNFKPNYLSVMNYSFVLFHDGIPGIGVTYSKWGKKDLYLLDEKSVKESDGVKSIPGGVPVPDNAKTVYYCPGNGDTKTVEVNHHINWNCAWNIFDRVKADINAPSRFRGKGFQHSYNKLRPYNDWRHLVFAGGSIGRDTVTWEHATPVR